MADEQTAVRPWDGKIDKKGSSSLRAAANQDPFKLSSGDFLSARETHDPLQAPPSFTNWMREQAWATSLYEPELLAAADARATIAYNGKAHSVINFCSYNY